MKHKRILSLILILFFSLFLLGGANLVLSQNSLEVKYPQAPNTAIPTTDTISLPNYVRYIFQFSLLLSAIIAFASCLYGGFLYLTSTGNPLIQGEARSRISSGILGLIILLSAYLILNTINPQLTKIENPSLENPENFSPTQTPQIRLSTYTEIPIGGLVENLWGKDNYKPALCYQYDENGDATSSQPEEHNRLDCIKWISKAIQIKAEKLKEAVEELSKFYNCHNCCRDCCKNVSSWMKCEDYCEKDEDTGNWKNCIPPANISCEGTNNLGYWGNCQPGYDCCQGGGMLNYSHQQCPYACCEFFEPCPCLNCGFDCSDIKESGYNCDCICIRPADGKCCNPENRLEHWEDPYIKSLVDKRTLKPEETDYYPDLTDIRTSLKELNLKIGLFSIMKKLQNQRNADDLLNDQGAQDLIKNILIGGSAKIEASLKAGENWSISFKTTGQGNLTISPSDPNNLTLLSLTCNGEAKSPTNWTCDGKGTATYKSKKDGKYSLSFNFDGDSFSLTNSTKGEIVGSDKLKKLLKIESVMRYIIEEDYYRNLFLRDRNLAKVVLFNFDLLRKEVAINEINWMGVPTDPTKEWIELYNNTNGNIDLSGWKLSIKGKTEIELSGTIPAKGFYLWKNTENTEVFSDRGENLELYDNFGNIIDSVNCSSGWFAGDNNAKKPMERINPQKEGSDPENWETSFFVGGTPQKSNNHAVSVIPYSSFNSLVSSINSLLSRKKDLREELIITLRQKGNLKQILKSRETLENILSGKKEHLVQLVSQREVLRILLENQKNLESMFSNQHIKDFFKKELGIETEEDWQEFLDTLPISTTNLKLVNDFYQDLNWLMEGADMMGSCSEKASSIDNLILLGPEEEKIKRPPEWEEINPQPFTPLLDYDPATFYCPKILW